MATEPSVAEATQREVITGLQRSVAENLTLLTPVEQAWQPAHGRDSDRWRDLVFCERAILLLV